MLAVMCDVIFRHVRAVRARNRRVRPTQSTALACPPHSMTHTGDMLRAIAFALLLLAPSSLMAQGVDLDALRTQIAALEARIRAL